MEGNSETHETTSEIQHSDLEKHSNETNPQKNWLNSLPYPKIYQPYGTGGDANLGETLSLNWYRWLGEYDKKENTLNLTAAQTEYTNTVGEFTYDTRFAKIETDGNIVLIADNPLGFKPAPTENNKLFSYHNTFNQPGYDELPTMHNENKLIYRGISETDLNKYIKDGFIVTGDLVNKISQEGQIFFGTEPNQPFGYAAGGRQFDMASFDHPAYMISIEKPNEVEKRKDEAVVLKNPIPVEEIVHIYEIRPAAIKTGHIPDVIPNDKSEYLALPSTNITSFCGPKGTFMYKEVSSEELKTDSKIIK